MEERRIDPLTDCFACVTHGRFTTSFSLRTPSVLWVRDNWSLDYIVYISFCVGATDEERDKMHTKLLTSFDFVEAEVFSEAKEKMLDIMEKAWIRFLKEDVKIFIEYAHIFEY